MPASKKRHLKATSKRPTEQGGAAAAVVRKIVALHGGKRTLATAMGNAISRPLLVALCNGGRETTVASVAALCRVCPNELAEELIAAHLKDEVARIQKHSAPVDTSSDEAALAAARRLIEPFPDHAEVSRKARQRRPTTRR